MADPVITIKLTIPWGTMSGNALKRAAVIADAALAAAHAESKDSVLKSITVSK